jgi:hypothetical protein
MLTRLKFKHGEGSLEEANPEIGRVFRRREMASPREGHPFGSEEAFFEAFMAMKAMVEELYKDRKKVEEGGPSRTTAKVEGDGGDPPKTPPSPSSSSSSSSSSGSSSLKKHSKKTPSDFPLLKLDVKFDLPYMMVNLMQKSWITGSSNLKFIAGFKRLLMTMQRSN